MMNGKLIAGLVLSLIAVCNTAQAQQCKADIPYVKNGHERQVLDIYMPEQAAKERLPVMFWIHGGGWQVGDKRDVALKPKVFTERGFIFVSTNYRLLPDVEMGDLIRDVASSLGWVSRNIGEYGGDEQRIFIGGHSAGAQLAALFCTDDRYLKEAGVSFQHLKGCVPVDGDTYDIPKIIMTAELRQTLYGGKMFTFGHRQKFGNDPDKHVDFSAVTHVAKEKDIPPFLLLYFSGNPDTTAQAHRLEEVLQQRGYRCQIIWQRGHQPRPPEQRARRADDPATKELNNFLDRYARGGEGASTDEK